MPKFLFIASTPKMAESAASIIKETGRRDTEVIVVKSTESSNAANFIPADTQIIIARGTTAKDIKRLTPLPVVELVLTAQEMGLMITRAKKIIHKSSPVIAIIGVPNMFCDMRDFDEIFDIKLKQYFIDSISGADAAVRKAIEVGVDLIIGGEVICASAAELGIPTLQQPAGDDSIRQAFKVADSIAWAADRERKNASQLETLLNFSFDGIIRIDNAGSITLLNNRAESFLGMTSAEVCGKYIWDVLPSLDKNQICSQVLKNGEEIFRTFYHTTGNAMAVTVAPIPNGDEIDGAILSCHELQRLAQLGAEAQRDMFDDSDKSLTHKTLLENTVENKSTLITAKNYAQFDECIYLSGSFSMERKNIARYIHDSSMRSSAAFINISGAAFSAGLQLRNIFGDIEITGAVMMANGGTLFLDEIELLCPEAQYRLYRLLFDKVLIRDGIEPTPANVRIIFGSRIDLGESMRNGAFRQDLYHVATALKIIVPALKGCPDEIGKWFNYYMDTFCHQYSRYVHVTRAAFSSVIAQPWDGGHAQLRSFCQKVAVSVQRRMLDEATVQRLLQNSPSFSVAALEMSGDASEIARLKILFEKHGGNRTLIANDMNISKTTLWRKLKKYNIS